MKKRFGSAGLLRGLGTVFGAALAVCVWLGAGIFARGAQEETIKQGIYIGGQDAGGMSREQAYELGQSYVDSLGSAVVTLQAAGGNMVQVTAKDLGITWANPQVVDEALRVGTTGSVITRYKVMKDLQYSHIDYEVKVTFDITAIDSVLASRCTPYDQEAVNATLKRENGQFVIQEGQTGYKLDVENSIDAIYNYMTGQWDGGDCSIPLVVEVDEPEGTYEQLARVKDVLGTFTTSFSTSGQSRSANVTNGCRLIDGTTLYPGEEFSTYDAVAPFTEANGYYMAGSYMNGKVIDSLGGGICQVSTTLYNAVLLAELDVTERHNHSMIVNYVDPSADAAIAESAGKDFRFVNNRDVPVYIEGSVSGKKITFTIYGEETRSSDRKVSYVSEVLETVRPEADTIYPDPSQPIGYIVKESAHIGYKARLWKVVTENGVQVSREEVNSSTYKMVPRSATVGVATADPNAYNEIMAAIGTASIDHVQNVIALLTAAPAVSGVIDPLTGAVIPGTGTVDPATGAVIPGAGTVDPATGAVIPGAGTADPAAGAADPGAGTADPAAGAADPAAGTAPDGGAAAPPAAVPGA